MSLSARNVTIGLIAALAAMGLKDVVYNKFFAKRAAPALTQAEARAIMRGLVEQLGPTVRACADLAKQVQQELAMGWGPVPTEKEMMTTYVYPTFKAEFVKIQDALCAEHNVCEWELEDAVGVYGQADAELASLAGDLAKLMSKFGAPTPGGEEAGPGDAPGGGGAPGGGAEGGMTLVDVLNELANRILTSTNEYCDAHIATHGIPGSPEESQSFSEGLQKMSEDIQNMFLGELGITQAVWQQLLQQSAQDPAVQQAFMRIQQGIQQLLASKGLQMM